MLALQDLVGVSGLLVHTIENGEVGMGVVDFDNGALSPDNIVDRIGRAESLLGAPVTAVPVIASVVEILLGGLGKLKGRVGLPGRLVKGSFARQGSGDDLIGGTRSHDDGNIMTRHDVKCVTVVEDVCEW